MGRRQYAVAVFGIFRARCDPFSSSLRTLWRGPGHVRVSATRRAGVKAEGKTWSGIQKGRRIKVNQDQEAIIKRLREDRVPVAQIAKAVELSRPTVYSVISGA